MINWLAFSCFAFLICWSRYRLESLRREVEEAEALESLLDAPPAHDAKAKVVSGAAEVSAADINRRAQ
jgi:hypothetical protein